MILPKVRRSPTKRNVDLVSSHDDEDEEEGPGLMSATDEQDPPALSSEILHEVPFRLKPGENLLYYEEYVPYVDRNEY